MQNSNLNLKSEQKNALKTVSLQYFTLIHNNKFIYQV